MEHSKEWLEKSFSIGGQTQKRGQVAQAKQMTLTDTVIAPEFQRWELEQISAEMHRMNQAVLANPTNEVTANTARALRGEIHCYNCGNMVVKTHICNARSYSPGGSKKIWWELSCWCGAWKPTTRDNQPEQMRMI